LDLTKPSKAQISIARYSRNSKCLEPLAKTGKYIKFDHWKLMLALAKNPYVPIDVIEVLARDTDWHVREAVAAHTKTPLPVLDMLAKDHIWEVALQVACNQNTSKNTLLWLSTHWFPNVAKKAIQRLEELNPLNCKNNSTHINATESTPDI
jgi:hypothetical protein